MQIRTLENQKVTELTELFNEAFCDYFVKVNLTAEYLKNKIISENIDLNKSVGIFSGGMPVGFILHAIRMINGEKVAYNAGTGVIPEFRGNSATIKMYNYALDLLKKDGVQRIFLEVIDKNIQAIKSYKKVGFNKEVNLECFKGKVRSKSFNKDVLIKKIPLNEVEHFQKNWDWEPTWQHTFETVKQLNSYKTFGVFWESELVGYAIFNAENGRTVQFTIEKNQRRKGFGTALFYQLSLSGPEDGLRIMNVNGNDDGTVNFLKSLGLEHFLRQHKMELNLNEL